ncbi:MAG: anaerobic glycerol-3-phosphate dehydrogenase subunit B [Chloroflexi bacterium]|nr:anaerobic glycerol-3-phosphate dehydrogenase subunit B [Chloroflexota bacterium]
MVYDLLIIGAGLSGLFAGCLAARRGKQALILARGLGGTHVGTGTIDVLSELTSLDKRQTTLDHPYGLAGSHALLAALDELKTICAEAGYPLHGDLNANFRLPTAAGATRQTCLAPETMIAGDLSRPQPFTLADLPGFRDFNANFAIVNLQPSVNSYQLSVIGLPIPHAPTHRDAYATDLAHLFDRADYREQLIEVWRPLLTHAPKRIGLPAILGLDHAVEAKRHLDSALGIELFEIPVLPPSVPGMRLFDILRNDFQARGGRIIIGPTVSGRIENKRATVTADANGRKREYEAEAIILATGGFLHGGLTGEFGGAIRESVFNLPVAAPSTRADWTSEVFLGPHPFAKFGVQVNKQLQPIGKDGKPVASNLRAVGSLLAGADRLSEGSRQGIELATAYRAIELL